MVLKVNGGVILSQYEDMDQRGKDIDSECDENKYTEKIFYSLSTFFASVVLSQSNLRVVVEDQVWGSPTSPHPFSGASRQLVSYWCIFWPRVMLFL